ncbi:hypothetical protein B0T17DRAFT_611343 [Bombardia bombarda]|uniref:Uncharacterized protein n=1 Tax=Bombardia bombarda TaxID=252184 RepID=A0AA39XHW7_9PEZI|nr:hypothetical protein B0T17DRAFT_611343 [Bombardia bombarda]
MKTFAIVAAFLASSISGVAAECWAGPPVWDVPSTPNRARSDIIRACMGYDGHGGAFSGGFVPGEMKYACIQTGPDRKIELRVQNQNVNFGYDLDDIDCVYNLFEEVRNCAQGGHHEGFLCASPAYGNC